MNTSQIQKRFPVAGLGSVDGMGSVGGRHRRGMRNRQGSGSALGDGEPSGVIEKRVRLLSVHEGL